MMDPNPRFKYNFSFLSKSKRPKQKLIIFTQCSESILLFSCKVQEIWALFLFGKILNITLETHWDQTWNKGMSLLYLVRLKVVLGLLLSSGCARNYILCAVVWFSGPWTISMQDCHLLKCVNPSQFSSS